MKILMKISILFCCILMISACRSSKDEVKNDKNNEETEYTQYDYISPITNEDIVDPDTDMEDMDDVEHVEYTEHTEHVAVEDTTNNIEDIFIRNLSQAIKTSIENSYPDIILEEMGYNDDGLYFINWNQLSLIIAPDYGDNIIVFKLSTFNDYHNLYDELARQKHEQVIKDIISYSVDTKENLSTAFESLMNKQSVDDFDSFGEYIGEKVHYRLVWSTFDTNRPPVFSGALTK